jgi:hypothetical protein
VHLRQLTVFQGKKWLHTAFFQLLILVFATPATQPTQVSDSAAFAMSLQSAMRPDAARAQAAATHESNATAQVHSGAVWSGDRNQ